MEGFLETSKVLNTIGSDPVLFQRYIDDPDFQALCTEANTITDGREALRFIIKGLLDRLDEVS